jgi:hypothetical protein
LSTLHRLLNLVSDAGHANDSASKLTFGTAEIKATTDTTTDDRRSSSEWSGNEMNNLLQQELMDIVPFLNSSDGLDLDFNGQDDVLNFEHGSTFSPKGSDQQTTLPSNRVLGELANFMVDDASMTLAIKRFLSESEDDIRAQRNLDDLNRQLFLLCEFHINNFLVRHGSSFDDLIKGMIEKNIKAPRNANFGLILLCSVADGNSLSKKGGGSSSSGGGGDGKEAAPDLSKPVVDLNQRAQQILAVKQVCCQQGVAPTASCDGCKHSWIADPQPLNGTRDRWWTFLSVPWLARKVIKFMLSAVELKISTEDLSAPVLHVDIRSRLGSISQLKFILDGKRHSFEFGQTLMFGLLSVPSHGTGSYQATFVQTGAVTSIRIERMLAARQDITPVHVIHFPTSDNLDLMRLENIVIDAKGEVVHSHTEAFRRYA